jgi:glucose/arabinose dehydrogenase
MLRRVASLTLLSLVFALPIAAEHLPGFSIHPIGLVNGFLTSLAVAPDDSIYYSVSSGRIYRFELDGSSTQVAKVDTAEEGNAVLLGIAFLDERRLVAKYVRPDLTADVVSVIDLQTGVITHLAELVCDKGRPCPTEHHGGNPIVATDGSIFFGIGDYGSGVTAQDPASPGGKIHRIAPDGTVSVWASGMRNPFDFAHDPVTGKLIVPDNGPVRNDEISIIGRGDNGGWPWTSGSDPHVEGTVRPSYVFEETTAPTGTVLIRRHHALPDGMLVAAFANPTIYYIADYRREIYEEPVALFQEATPPIIDVVQRQDGEILFATPWLIYWLAVPARGDVNGDGVVNGADVDALRQILRDRSVQRTIYVQENAPRASWGADVNGDGVIDALDLAALLDAGVGRRRTMRRP